MFRSNQKLFRSLILMCLRAHTDLGAHRSWRPFMSLHSWESHITLKTWKSTFTLGRAGVRVIKQGQTSLYCLRLEGTIGNMSTPPQKKMNKPNLDMSQEPKANSTIKLDTVNLMSKYKTESLHSL